MALMFTAVPLWMAKNCHTGRTHFQIWTCHSRINVIPQMCRVEILGDLPVNICHKDLGPGRWVWSVKIVAAQVPCTAMRGTQLPPRIDRDTPP